MVEETYYKAVEYFEDGSSIALMYPKNSDKSFSRKFKSYNDAEKAVEDAIRSRKNQYSYFRDEKGNIVDKVSFYERNKLTYKIFKVKEVRELLYAEDNSNIELKKVDNNLSEEMPLTL